MQVQRKSIPQEPKDPDFQQRIKLSFDRQRALQTLGIKISSVRPGEVDLTMLKNERYLQDAGLAHEGIISAALNAACFHAALSLQLPDTKLSTIEFKTNVVGAAKGSSFIFRGRVVQSGDALALCYGHAFAVEYGATALVATMSSSYMLTRDGGTSS